MQVKILSGAQSIFSIPHKEWSTEIRYMGNVELLDRPLMGIFSSSKCPASSILKAHDYAKDIRNGGMGVISGFHAPAEKEVLKVLLKGTCPLVIVLGRRLEGARIPAVWKAEVEKGRMLVVSPFKEYQKYVTKEMSTKRNDLAARIAGRVLIIHASEGGSLEGQVERWEADGLSVERLAQPDQL